MKGTKSKEAGTYSLISGTGIVKQITRMYKAHCKDTDDIWHAKIIDNEQIKSYHMGECIDFNKEVLLNCQNKDNVIYVKQIFQKANNTFIIQEIYDDTLINKVQKQLPLKSETIQQILNEIVNGLSQIYTEKYNTRSLRPENIISVDGVWKIESLVMDTRVYPVKSQFVWDNRFASPEERYKNGKIPRQMIDEQLVWQIGVLGLYMILGDEFKYDKIFKDTDIDWAKVKEIASPNLYKMLSKSLKVKYEERIRIKQFLQLQIFENIDSINFLAGLQTQSKFFDPKKFKKNAILTAQDQKIWKSLKNDVERFKVFGEVDKYIQDLPFRSNYDISLLRFLSFEICYQNLQKIAEECQKWITFDNNAASYKPLNIWLDELQLLINEAEKSKIQYMKFIKNNSNQKSDLTSIKQCLPLDLSDPKNVSYAKIMQIYCRIAGQIYTSLSKQVEDITNQSKERTICYYSLCSYLLYHMNLQDFQKSQSLINFRDYVTNTPINKLRSVTQELITKYFQVSS